MKLIPTIGPTVTGGGCGCVVIILVINALVGGLATQYCFNFWAPLFLGHVVHAPFWPCAALGLFVGEFTVPLAIFTWVLSFMWVPKIAFLMFK